MHRLCKAARPKQPKQLGGQPGSLGTSLRERPRGGQRNIGRRRPEYGQLRFGNSPLRRRYAPQCSGRMNPN